MSFLAWIIAPLWIAAGIGMYFFYARSRVLPSEDEIVVIEEEAAPAGDEYRVMVPIANPMNALSLVGNTIKLCADRKTRIKLLHLTTVPDLLTLADAQQHIMEGKEGIVEAMLYLMPRFPLTTTILHCRNVARGIVSAVRDKRINLLIMGWHGKKCDQRFRIGSTLDQVISRSPCDIIILKDCGNKKFQSTVVPVFRTPHDELALETALRLTETGGQITLLPVENRKNLFPSKYLKDLMTKAAGQQVICLEPVLTDKTAAILKTAGQYELMVLGIHRTRSFPMMAPHSLQEALAHNWDNPLAIVKKAGGLGDFTKRWF